MGRLIATARRDEVPELEEANQSLIICPGLVSVKHSEDPGSHAPSNRVLTTALGGARGEHRRLSRRRPPFPAEELDADWPPVQVFAPTSPVERATTAFRELPKCLCVGEEWGQSNQP